MVSDEDSSIDSSELGEPNKAQQRPLKKRRRKIEPDSFKNKDKKRKSSDNRLGDIKIQPSLLHGASGVASRPQGLFPPALASLLTPNPNQMITFDPSFLNPGAEPLRRWMHLTRPPHPQLTQQQAQIIDPFALSVVGLQSLSTNQQSLLPGLPYFSGAGGAASSLSNPTFSEMLNLAMTSVQSQHQPQPLGMDASLRRDLSLSAAATQQFPVRWDSLPFSSLGMMEQMRRMLEMPPISLDELGRASLTSAATRQETTIPMLESEKSILDRLVNAQNTRAASRTEMNKTVLLSIPEDEVKLNEQQVFLRRQIEVFRATEDDILSHTRGRNKPISLYQAGLRCRHCGNLPVSKRRKGSTYFPSSLMGLYQAAQNLGVEHLFTLVCPELPQEVKAQASAYANKKVSASNAGKPYWAESGKKLGLVDTEYGIRFTEDIDRNGI